MFTERSLFAERLAGLVNDVTQANAGDVLATDATAGDAVLYLDDASDFDEDGGTVQISDGDNTELIAYTFADLDLNTIQLADVLANSYSTTGTAVDVYPITRLTYASVQPAGSQDDPVTAVVPTQVPIGLGTRDDAEREQCVIEWEEESEAWIVRDIYVTDASPSDDAIDGGHAGTFG